MSSTNIIKINSGSFDDAVNSLKTYAEEMRDSFKLLQSSSRVLESSWQGVAGTEYKNGFASILTTFEILNTELENIADALHETSASFSELDRSLSDTMDGE